MAEGLHFQCLTFATNFNGFQSKKNHFTRFLGLRRYSTAAFSMSRVMLNARGDWHMNVKGRNNGWPMMITISDHVMALLQA